MVSHKVLKSWSPVSMNVTLFGNKIFYVHVNICHLVGFWFSMIVSLGIKEIWIKRQTFTEGRSGEDTERTLSTSQVPWSNHQLSERQVQTLPHSSQKELDLPTAWFRILSIQNCGTVSICCLSNPVCNMLLWQPGKTKVVLLHFI